MSAGNCLENMRWKRLCCQVNLFVRSIYQVYGVYTVYCILFSFPVLSVLLSGCFDDFYMYCCTFIWLCLTLRMIRLQHVTCDSNWICLSGWPHAGRAPCNWNVSGTVWFCVKCPWAKHRYLSLFVFFVFFFTILCIALSKNICEMHRNPPLLLEWVIRV